MQWLIDLVIEAIGVPPVFIDRGDPATSDWNQATLTLDGAWHELDISAIVPTNASAILFRGLMRDGAIAKRLGFRKAGHVNAFNTSIMYTQVADVFIQQDCIIAVTTNQKIEYIADAGIDLIFLTIAGWWL